MKEYTIRSIANIPPWLSTIPEGLKMNTSEFLRQHADALIEYLAKWFTSREIRVNHFPFANCSEKAQVFIAGHWSSLKAMIKLPFQRVGKSIVDLLVSIRRITYVIFRSIAIGFLVVSAVLVILGLLAWLKEYYLKLSKEHEQKELEDQRKRHQRVFQARSKPQPRKTLYQEWRECQQSTSILQATYRNSNQTVNYSTSQLPSNRIRDETYRPPSPPITDHFVTVDVPTSVDGDLERYIEYAARKAAKQFLFHVGKAWKMVYEDLMTDLGALYSRPVRPKTEQISLSDLQQCIEHPYDMRIVQLILDKSLQCPSLQLAGVEYLFSLLPPYCKNPISDNGGPVFGIPMETIEDGGYAIRSTFTALHAILQHCLPENQTIRQYLSTFLLFATLLKRAFGPFLENCPENINPKIAILICCDYPFRLSKAFIGFSVIALRRVKDEIIRDRRENLPDLCDPPMARDGYWEPGNCAEAETFAHLRKMANKWKGREMLVVSLALDMKTLEPCGFCYQCRYVIRKLSKECHFVWLDLAPPRIS